MKANVIHCGPFANESEQRAVDALKTRLIGQLGEVEWLLLTNLPFSTSDHRQPDEIDIIAIGPPGVRVIEVKHWTAAWVRRNRGIVEHEADRVTTKARRVGTTLRRSIKNVGRVDGVFLVTQEAAKVKPLDGERVRGVPFHTLKSWSAALGMDGSPVLAQLEVSELAKLLYPKSPVALDGSLQRMAGYVNLQLQTPPEERFHRIYKGVHSRRRNQVRLHLYDLSASDHSDPANLAGRECDALQRLQIHGWAPRIEDSFQEAQGYQGEMCFFAESDPAAPNIAERAGDSAWDIMARIEFARGAVQAVMELHGIEVDGQPMLHRNLSPSTILVKHDNTPILTGFHYARIPADSTVVGSGLEGASEAVAPEVCESGLAAADRRSDVYSLCASLCTLFDDQEDALSRDARQVLRSGMAEDRGARGSLKQIQNALSGQLGETPSSPPVPPSRFWTEDQIVRFRDRDYRIVSRLGSGGVGTTFKVVERDRKSGGDLGAYVAKVVHDEDIGKQVLGAYDLGRAHIRHSALSTIYETADKWLDNRFVALMAWIEGQPLSDLVGVLPIYAEDVGEDSGEALVLSWLRTLCEALGVLHRNGLVHGDVSPRNLIVAGNDIVLTDYDCLARVGQPLQAPGTVIYSAHVRLADQLATPSSDFFALAASFFHVLFEKEPFRYDGDLAKERGLNWTGVPDLEQYPIVTKFLDRATDPEPVRRFDSAHDALAMLQPAVPAAAEVVGHHAVDGAPTVIPRDEVPLARQNEVPWLRSVLQSYPGSRWGNSETRGLDSDFASNTYVETGLEEALIDQVRGRHVRLVILCGNAGDGKTALLQHLAKRLGLGEPKSDTRILEGVTNDGLTIRMNLDGSASWRGDSADKILDRFLLPFHQGPPGGDLAHLLAINDGRLLEWIERVEDEGGDSTPLTEALEDLLDGDESNSPSHIRFINLNQRSLVGGITTDEEHIETKFLDELVDLLYGGDQAADHWRPCATCVAEPRCEVRRAMRLFGPATIPGANVPQRERARERLFEALQAVHLRGETHITVRELRATLVYILFGTHFCSDYHNSSGLVEQPEPYWDRAFAPDSFVRQGEVLRELVRFDPGLEANPKVDRHLSRFEQVEANALVNMRRQAYFEMAEKELEEVAGDSTALGLARSKHLKDFRDLLIRKDRTDDLCRRLCAGISRLEDLPPQALDREGVVPLRITPRTPTETAFWVEKGQDRFRLKIVLPQKSEGLSRLHREATLIYRYRDGTKERLRLGADLFHVLSELADGYQLGDVSTDDTFAQLSIFVQRLVREDERRLLAWTPMQDDAIYEIAARLVETATSEDLQQVQLSSLEGRNAE